MTSTLAWLDFSADEQRRAREIAHFFLQTDSRDELGMGVIRDVFSDLLFPGISTIQTRARYFLFVPWIVRHAERLDAEQHQILSLQQQLATAAAAMPKLEQRVGALEQKPLTIPPEFGEMRQRIDAVSAGISDLTPRLERLTNAVQVQARGVADLTTRVDPADLYPSLNPLTWPQVSLLPMVAILAGALPAWLAPPPAPSQETPAEPSPAQSKETVP